MTLPADRQPLGVLYLKFFRPDNIILSHEVESNRYRNIFVHELHDMKYNIGILIYFIRADQIIINSDLIHEVST